MKAEQKTVASGQRPVASDEASRSGPRPDGATSRAALRAADLGHPSHAQRASSSGLWPLSPGPSRSAFTLVELMVTMAIIAILGAAMAYAVAGAQQSANIAKTRSLIAKIHSLVMQKYESYRTRRLPISIPAFVLDPTNGPKDSMNNPIPIPTPARAIAQVRCDAIRQLMRMEMPERWTDVIDDPQPITVQQPGSPPGSASPWVYFDVASATPDGKGGYTNVNNPAVVTMVRPSSSQAYLAVYNGVYGATKSGNDPPAAAAKHQAAKCLYLLITMGLDDPDALENFSQQDIVDFDKSGCKEFVDAWGNPIWFLRWAPGMVSALQPDAPTPGSTARDQRMRDLTDPTGVYGSPQPGALVLNPATSSQTSGPSRKGGNTFALYPLIFSAGPDSNYDTVAEWFGKGFFHYKSTNPANNPFSSVSDTTDFPCAVPAASGYGGGPFGAPFCDPGRAFGNADNITNQDIGAR